MSTSDTLEFFDARLEEALRGERDELPEATDVTIESLDGELSVNPFYVRMVDVTEMANDTSHTSMCGKSVYEKNGDKPARATIEGVVLESELRTLEEMNVDAAPVRVVSDVHTGVVEFDQFTKTQKNSLNYAAYQGEQKELAFAFQLQTKDESSE